MTSEVTRFVGSIPAIYDAHMGPALFEPYARELASRLARIDGARHVLEIAAGTGRVTRQLMRALCADGTLVATDLNEPMIAIGAERVPADPRLTWRTADALALPFADASFDVVVCQFGLMFLPDKPCGLREMHRVLEPGGTLLLTTWDLVAKNRASEILHELAYRSFPSDPPLFMALPFSMHDAGALEALVEEAGFTRVVVETVGKIGEAESAAHLATGFVRGNPLWNQLVTRGIDAGAFEASVAGALAAEFGDNPCRSPLSAHVVTAVA